MKIQCLSLAHFFLSVKMKLITFHKTVLSIYTSSVIIMSVTNFLHLKKDLICQFANLRHSCPQRTAVLAVWVYTGDVKQFSCICALIQLGGSPGPLTHPGDSSGSITCFHCTACKLQLAPSVNAVQQDIIFFQLREVAVALVV